jgi:hypothetical protein
MPVYLENMFEVKVLNRVQVIDPKFEGSGLVVYLDDEGMTLRDDSNEYHRGIRVSSVTGVEPQNPKLDRSKLLRAFEEVLISEDETKVVTHDGIPGILSYYKPDGLGIVSFRLPEARDNKELWFVTSFNKRYQLWISDSDNPKDIDVRHLRPFEIQAKLIDSEGVEFGRDREKELSALYDRLETILASMVVTAPCPLFKDSRRLCLEHIEECLGDPPTWIFDGEEMLDTLPETPGLYLCGNQGTGRITRLAGTDKLCIYVDSRLSVVVKVVNHD